MAEGQGTTLSATQDKKGGAPIQLDNNDNNGSDSSSSWLSKPQDYGNTAGSTIKSTLSPVGDKVGKGLETAAKPVGSVVDGVVGGVMRGGEAFGDTAKVGFGNRDEGKEGWQGKEKDT